MLAPICLFVYNRFEETKQTIEALQANFLAKDSELIIFSDGPKDKKSKNEVQTIRNYLKTVDGFKKVEIYESVSNKGLAKSIIGGVSQVIKEYGNIIVLEDDLITTPNFLDFMNTSLSYYEQFQNVFSITGFTLPIEFDKKYKSDIYFSYRASSWGWAIWKDRWFSIDWELAYSENFMNDRKIQRGFKIGGDDLSRMLKNQILGKIDSWAIRFCYYQFRSNKLTVAPIKSKIKNIGFNNKGTHTKTNAREYQTILDKELKLNFNFSNELKVETKINKQFRFYYSNYYKIKHRVLNYFQR